VNRNPGAPAGGTGVQYFVGSFDGAKFTNETSPGRELWADYGKDFYATNSFSDVPAADGRRIWIGWMSNWQYAQDVPTSPWRSAMSLPREVGLRETHDGLRLVQKPVRELAKLRGEHHRLRRSDIAGANAWLNQQGVGGDNLELSVEFDAIAQGVQGLKVLKGATQETVIGIDHERGRVFVDRTRSGATDFHPRFTGVHEAPLRSQNGKVKLQVFVDACSVEVFVNDGEVVFTDLVFPSVESRGVEFFGGGKTPRIRALNVWELNSSWK